MQPTGPRTAFVRHVPVTLPRALAKEAPPTPIDVDLARRQHAAYVEALRALGLETVELPADERYPDCCFVEDTAVVAGGVALIPNLGAATRRGESPVVAAALARHGLPLESMTPPATLDGGDCLRIGARIWVGLSERTNAAGLARAKAVFEPRGLEVRGVPLERGLHLKSSCSGLDDHTVLVADGALPVDAFRGLTVLTVPPEEALAANVVAVGRSVLLAAGCPRTQAMIEGAGFRAIPVDTGELRKADGALTCLSILV